MAATLRPAAFRTSYGAALRVALGVALGGLGVTLGAALGGLGVTLRALATSLE